MPHDGKTRQRLQNSQEEACSCMKHRILIMIKDNLVSGQVYLEVDCDGLHAQTYPLATRYAGNIDTHSNRVTKDHMPAGSAQSQGQHHNMQQTNAIALSVEVVNKLMHMRPAYMQYVEYFLSIIVQQQQSQQAALQERRAHASVLQQSMHSTHSTTA